MKSTMMSNPEEMLHFFSYETKVSLELPIGWEEYEETTGQVTYAADEWDPIDDNQYFSKLIIKTFLLANNHLNNLQQIAEQALSVNPHQNILIQKSTIVDGYPAMVYVLNYQEMTNKADLCHYQVFVKIDNFIWSITGIVNAKYQEKYIPIFDKAIESIRFILV